MPYSCCMAIKIIADNRKARFNYEIIETMEAGVCLQGSEVKSLREGLVNLKDSYVATVGEELFLQNAYIPEYKASSYNNHTPERKRKLLLHRKEIVKVHRAITEKGLTCVPTKLYWKRGRVKLEIALARGKKQHDKRESIKQKDIARDLRKQMRRSSR